MDSSGLSASHGRLHGADAMRAVACLMVLVHHLAQRLDWDAGLDLGSLQFLRVFAKAGAYGVPIFFVLSGFLLARPFWTALDAGSPMPSLRVYWLRRAARILPGYWLALLVSFVAALTAFGVTADADLVFRLVVGVFGLGGWHWSTLYPVEVNGPLWSIGYELMSYALLPLGFALLFATGDKSWLRSRALWVGVIAVALVGHWVFMQLNPSPTFERGWEFGLTGGAKLFMPSYNPIGFFAMFAAGALAAAVQVSIARRKSWLFDVLAIYAIAMGVLILLFHVHIGDTDQFGWLDLPYRFPWFVICVALFLTVAPSSKMIGELLDNPVSQYVARLSFGIYIWHYLVLELVRLYIMPDMAPGQMRDATGFVFASGLVLMATFAIAALSYRFVELPAMRWARRWEGATPAASSAATPSAIG